jgi:nucleotide-binding universal stress UspA family protein
MEAVLDEERRDVLALLEPSAQRVVMSINQRSPSPFTPRSPVRSMLDVSDSARPPIVPVPIQPAQRSPPRPTPAVRSMLDIDSPPPPPPTVRSMLDVESPPPTAMKQVFSNPTSPIDTTFRAPAANHVGHPRSLSDAATRPADFGPRSSARGLLSPDPMNDYQFSDIITNSAGNTMPKRVSQAPFFNRGARSSMAEALQTLGQPSGGRMGNKSKSPRGRLGGRSSSPGVGLLQPRHLSPAGRAIVAENKGMNFDNAYRRLSDANMARSGGSLSELGRRKRSDDLAGSGRLAKSYLTPDGDELPEEESSDDHHGSSSDDDEDAERGRKAARSFNPSSTEPEDDPTSPGSDTAGKRQTLSLLAAAEEERIEVASKQPAYKYRSLLDDPEITVTGPSGSKVKSSKGGVHPATSFDQPPRDGTQTPVDSDTEADLTDIRRAQKLAFSMTHIMSYPEAHRAIRIIHRGDYTKIAQDMEAEEKRSRKYLVATDLSDESTHALEWAIGTVLRDGDTLIAIYCVDEELGIAATEATLVPDDPKAMREQAAAINVVTNSKAPVTPAGIAAPLQHFKPSPLTRAADKAGISPSPAPSSREHSKAEEERMRAVQDITNRIEKLLRKTRLQVRVIVEVLHCKNPKHLITEVIDLIRPTLVILGSRGRSALKGYVVQPE